MNLLRAAQAAVIALPISFLGTSYADESPSGISAFCWYSMLLEFHEISERCGNRLEAADEARYKQITDAVRSYIVENSRLAKEERFRSETFLSDYEAQAAAKYRQWDKHTCERMRFPGAKSELEGGTIRSLLSPKSTVTIFNDLKTPRDPFAGGCI